MSSMHKLLFPITGSLIFCLLFFLQKLLTGSHTGINYDITYFIFVGISGWLTGLYIVKLKIDNITSLKQVLEELKYHAIMENAVTKISGLFVLQSEVNYNKVLEIISEISRVNRTYIFQIKDEKTSNIFEWCSQGTKPQIDNLQNIPLNATPWWMAKMYKNENIIIRNVEELPAEAESEKKIFLEQQIKSLIAVPIWLNQKILWGFMGFDDTQNTREWRDSEIDAFRVVADMLSKDMFRKKSEKKVKNLQKQLQQAQKMEAIGTLAGGIAHDFNNILFPVMGYTEMLLEDIPEESPLKESLEEIYHGTLRAKELVKQILTFARQRDGELKLMQIQLIVKEALKLIRSTLPTTIEIKQNIQQDCRPIKADPTHIHQIVMNLTTNAYHAMEEQGGVLGITLKEIELGESNIIDQDMTAGIYACLSISDTGKGMNQTLIQKIFDPFFTTKGKAKGTGMGLSVVHGIIASMKGTIEVDSKSGKGTQFNVYIPVVKTIAQQDIDQQDKLDVKDQIHSGTEHILLVDDEVSIIKMEQNMLERLGYKVTSRSSSVDALEAFRANPDKFDLIITDMTMPNMSGDKLAIELIRIRFDIPILLCSGFSETITKEKAESIGISGFLHKPIVTATLSKKIREVLA